MAEWGLFYFYFFLFGWQFEFPRYCRDPYRALRDSIRWFAKLWLDSCWFSSSSNCDSMKIVCNCWYVFLQQMNRLNISVLPCPCCSEQMCLFPKGLEIHICYLWCCYFMVPSFHGASNLVSWLLCRIFFPFLSSVFVWTQMLATLNTIFNLFLL